MIDGALYSLGDITITNSAEYIGDWVEDLDGMAGATIQVGAAIGTAGAKIQVYVQTSLDQGETAVDIACVTFIADGTPKILNFSTDGAVTEHVPSDGTMSDDTMINGILGDRLRMKIVTTGTYANTVVSGRAAVR